MKISTATTNKFAERRVRKGKTAKDRASGAAKRDADNKAARVSWQHNNRATNDTFPGRTQ